MDTPIGLVFPLRNGPISGYFDQSFDSFTQIKTNIINLLRTIPGERRMQPTFGCRLWNTVFDPNENVLVDKITNIIKEDINKWIPSVMIKNVTVEYYSGPEISINSDIYRLHVVVEFIITSIKHEDKVEIFIDKNKI